MYFPAKGKLAINKKEGTFIPVAQNVFLKYYTPTPEQMTFWGKGDGEYYIKDIKKILYKQEAL